MSEALLKAIIDLFVIVAKEDDITASERDTVIKFLKDHLNQRNVPPYIDYFDQQGERLLARGVDEEADLRDIQDLCTKFNNELTRKQKTVMIKELVELIIADGIISDSEKRFLDAIRSGINYPKEEVEALNQFVLGQDITSLEGNLFLVYTDTGRYPGSEHRPGLEGNLCFIRLPWSDSYFVKYLGRTELQLNNIPLQPSQIMVFSTGSVIRGSKNDPIYYSDVISHFMSEKHEDLITFQSRNVGLTFPNGHTGLRNINLHETSGRLVGIMGGSGAGKSTLMNVLNGAESLSEGEVLINGINIHSETKKVEGAIGFVPQDDLLIEDLTVYQNLFYAGKLCFENLSDHELGDIVTRTLKNLGLLEIKDLKVGSPLKKTISGGQRKRVNIGLELLREPSVLFVDEPTSGLSSRDSENIMDLLKELSLKGKLVFVVIHQPSSDIFKMFDKLTILDVGGYQIYYGNPVEAVVYFKEVINMINKEESQCISCGNVNPEQIFNIIEAKVIDEYGQLTDERKISPEQWNKYFEQQIGSKEESIPPREVPARLKIPGFLRQFQVFLVRDVLSKLANRQYMIINLVEAPLLAFLLAFIVRFYSEDESAFQGYLFAKNENIPSYIFMSIIVALFMGLTVSAEEIFKDRKILKREQFLNLSKGSYLLSKVVLLLILSATQTVLFVSIAHWILDIRGMFLPFWAILFSCSFFANILGLNISSAFNSAVTIYILIPILLIPQLLLSGVVVKFDKLNPRLSDEAIVPFIGDLMASRWAMEAAMVAQFKDNKFQKLFFEVDKEIANTEYKQVYFLPRLNTKLDNALSLMNPSKGDQGALAANLSLLQNELRRELLLVGSDKFQDSEKLVPEKFDTEVHKSTKNFLDQLKKFYNARHGNALKAKSQMIAELNETPEKKEEFETLRNNYSNENITRIVTNSAEPRRIMERDGKLIRKINPIYMTPAQPANPLDFRSPFYVAEKYFGSGYVPTLIFNLGFIWFMSILLYVFLYYEVLRKLVNLRIGGKG